MKLVPLFRFWGDKGGGEEENDLPETLDDDLLQIPADEQPTDSQEEGEKASDDAEEEKKEGENAEAQGLGGRDEELLKMFASVDEDYVDNSALTNDIEDIPVSELLQELRAIAAAFGRPVAADDDLA